MGLGNAMLQVTQRSSTRGRGLRGRLACGSGARPAGGPAASAGATLPPPAGDARQAASRAPRSGTPGTASAKTEPARDQRPVAPRRLRWASLPSQHLDLLPQQQYFGVLRRRRPRQKHGPGQGRHEEPIDEAETHEQKSCHTPRHPRSSQLKRQYWHPTGHKDNTMAPDSPCETANELRICVGENNPGELE